jgi:hypothetical protein
MQPQTPDDLQHGRPSGKHPDPQSLALLQGPPLIGGVTPPPELDPEPPGAVAAPVQVPTVHTCPFSVQFTHETPAVPHVTSPLCWQTPAESQHPSMQVWIQLAIGSSPASAGPESSSPVLSPLTTGEPLLPVAGLPLPAAPLLAVELSGVVVADEAKAPSTSNTPLSSPGPPVAQAIDTTPIGNTKRIRRAVTRQRNGIVAL